jgi:hypothetical protein
MLTIAEAQRQTELFLTGQMFEALQGVEYELPSFDTEAREVQLADVARSRVEIRHVRRASDATYLVNALWRRAIDAAPAQRAPARCRRKPTAFVRLSSS